MRRDRIAPCSLSSASQSSTVQVFYIGIALAVLILMEGILILKFNDLLKELKELLEFLHGHHHKVVRLVIVSKESNMADVVQGGTLAFEVQGFNKFSVQVPLTDATVGVDNPDIGTDTVSAAGTGGVFTAGTVIASGNITAAAAGLTATPLPVNVVADTVVASVTIVPTP